MKILFTGASSFTGYWFARELAAAGHHIVMTFRRGKVGAYQDLRRVRIEKLLKLGRPVFACRFGDETFLRLIGEEASWELLCHHAADVTSYKSPDFDVATAFKNNTHNLGQVLAALVDRGCQKILLTGSVFEGGEGAGSEGLPAFSPYGLSKQLTAEMFGCYARLHGLRLGKFVIANPFGPYEEPRFTAYLMRTWFAGETAVVKTPAYVRDNIHVSLLAKAYADFANGLPAEPGFQKLNPSGYVENQGAFAARFAREMRPRLGLLCELELKQQTEFSEPRVRINVDPVHAELLGWNEARSWDEIAEYYRHAFAEQQADRG